MKSLPVSLALLGILLPVSGQEAVPKWDVTIPESIADGRPAAPAGALKPIDFAELKTRTKRMEVIEAPEMPELPPVTGKINVTVQLIQDPKLPISPPLAALPPDDPAVVARLEELRESYRGTELVFLSCTVFDHHRTLLRIYPNGKTDQEIVAWSNLDFNQFSGFSTYRVKDGVDGSLYDFGLLMGIGNTATADMQKLAETEGIKYEAPEISELPDLVAGGPAFVVVKGALDSPARNTLEQVHDLYRQEGARMEAAYQAREQARAERIADLLANPPQPEDVTVRFWRKAKVQTTAQSKASQP